MLVHVILAEMMPVAAMLQVDLNAAVHLDVSEILERAAYVVMNIRIEMYVPAKLADKMLPVVF